MDFQKLILTARENARMARERGLRTVRLPVLAYEDWALLYGHNDLAAQQAHYLHQKRNFYFKRFLEGEGIDVTMVTCRATDVMDWAFDNDHPLTNDHERAHVLAHYAGQPDLPPSKCVHKRPLTTAMAGLGWTLYGTITAYGERTDLPEILSLAIHTRDGQVVESMEILAIEHTTAEAFDRFQGLMARHGVTQAFHDPVVHRPQFCADCNELLVNVASELEYQRLK
jgi:hypothetical protein